MDVILFWVTSFSTFQIDKAMLVVLQIDEVFDAKPAIMRAFQLAKASVKSSRQDVGDDYIEFKVKTNSYLAKT